MVNGETRTHYIGNKYKNINNNNNTKRRKNNTGQYRYKLSNDQIKIRKTDSQLLTCHMSYYLLQKLACSMYMVIIKS